MALSRALRIGRGQARSINWNGMSLDLEGAASSAPAPSGDKAPPSKARSPMPAFLRLAVTLVLAIFSLELLLAGVGWQQSPGTSDTFLEFAVFPIILGSVVGLP